MANTTVYYTTGGAIARLLEDGVEIDGNGMNRAKKRGELTPAICAKGAKRDTPLYEERDLIAFAQAKQDEKIAAEERLMEIDRRRAAIAEIRAELAQAESALAELEAGGEIAELEGGEVPSPAAPASQAA